MSKARDILRQLSESGDIKPGDNVEFTKDFNWSEKGEKSGWRKGTKAKVKSINHEGHPVLYADSLNTTFDQTIDKNYLKKV